MSRFAGKLGLKSRASHLFKTFLLMPIIGCPYDLYGFSAEDIEQMLRTLTSFSFYA
jgi:hypothetical protein